MENFWTTPEGQARIAEMNSATGYEHVPVELPMNGAVKRLPVTEDTNAPTMNDLNGGIMGKQPKVKKTPGGRGDTPQAFKAKKAQERAKRGKGRKKRRKARRQQPGPLQAQA